MLCVRGFARRGGSVRRSVEEEGLRWMGEAVLGLLREGVVGEQRVKRGLGRRRFALPALRGRGCVRWLEVEAQASRVSAIESCRSGRGRSHRRLLAVCLAGRTVEEGVWSVRVLEALLTVVVAAERGVWPRAAEAVVRTALKRVEAGAVVRMGWMMEEAAAEQGVRCPGQGVRARAMVAVEGPCPRAFERREAVSAASCQWAEVVLASRLCSRPESQRA